MITLFKRSNGHILGSEPTLPHNIRRIQMATTDAFSRELMVFEQHRKEWSRSHPGEYVVIQDDVIAEGFFKSYADAFKAGLQKFGVRREFLVKQVWNTEPVYFVS
jgi:hypothetical protein